MSRFFNPRVRLALVLLALIPIGGLILHAGLEGRSRALLHARNEILTKVDEVANAQQRLISNAYQVLFTISHLSQTRTLDGKACTAILTDLLKQSKGYTVFLIATPGGDVIANAPALDHPITASGRPYYANPLKPEGSALRGSHIARVNGKPTVLVVYPVFEDENRLRAILLAGVSLEWLSQVIDLGGFPTGAAVTLLDRTGTILFHHPDPKHIAGKSVVGPTLVEAIKRGKGVVEGFGPDNVKRIYGFTSFDNNSGNLYVSIEVPSQTALAEPTKKMLRSFLWLGIVALLVLSTIWFTGYSAIIHPLRQMLGVIQQLARGNLAVRTGISDAPGEVRELAMALDQMADSLQSREQELKRAEESMRESEMHYRRIIETIDEGVWMLDAKHTTTFTNKKTAQMLGYTRDEMRGKSFFEFTDGEGRLLLERRMLDSSGERHGQLDLLLRGKGGTALWAIISPSPVFNKNGKYDGILITMTDITERKKAEEQLKYMSLHDPLTGIYNRAYFEEGMKRLESTRFAPVGIILCDVDGLKFINDALGHKMGDSVLVAAARIIKECFRGSDMVARVGGDEFAVILPNSRKALLENACRRMRHAISDHNTSHVDIPLSLSIGCAVDGRKSLRLNSLYQEADHNMYKDKLYNRRNARRKIVQALTKALETKDFMTEAHMNRLRAIIKTFTSVLNIPRHLERDLHLFAQFHDIGKVGVPDSILFKPEKLSSEEYTEMKRHCEIGYRIAQFSPDLVSIADLILKHHEWWNGKGYPLGVKGHDIPLECRILAITDAYDSMTSLRPYRNPMSHEDAVRELNKCAGTQFNRDLVGKFIQAMAAPTSRLMRSL